MNKKSMTKIVGIIFTIMWVSWIPYLFPHPFQEHKGIRNLATDVVQGPNWIKEASPIIKDKTADELGMLMMIELRFHWIKSALFIVMGVLSGWWLIQRRKGGYLLAFFFSLLIIGIRLVNLLRYRKFTLTLETYKLLLSHYPVRTIHEILMYLVLLGTVIFLIYTFKDKPKEKEGTEE
jgi:hypothetical protein